MKIEKNMNMAYYIAVIHKEAESDFGVSFPDFSGCISAGSTLQEAREMAQEALQAHIHWMLEDNDAIPQPSTLDSIRAEGMEGDLFFEVAVHLPVKSKAVRINISLPEMLVQEIDSFASSHSLTRSAFLATAARQVFTHGWQPESRA